MLLLLVLCLFVTGFEDAEYPFEFSGSAIGGMDFARRKADGVSLYERLPLLSMCIAVAAGVEWK